ncbi:minor tail protein [Arthrobacter phage Whytu]|uniref:Minor tail protein n=1 Tax=Arthrobacter phage Whytu TaxID=2713260 RepID=A0A6G8R2Q4_9CAUD|nr:minor tail protein [Arthrobacter phage Whytu]QIN94480.1 minor tail protein [Arthrobacter phage Whytu]
MATTTKRSYRYPGQGQEPDAAADIQKLAEDVDNDVAKLFDGLPDKIQAGDDSISIGAGATSITKTILYPTAFATVPKVTVQNTANVGGRASLLTLYVNSKTVNGFTVKMQTSDNAAIGTSYAIAFDWIAVGA